MYYFYSKMMKDLNDGVRQEIEPSEDGKIVLKINRYYSLMGIIFMVISVICLLLAIFTYGSNEEGFFIGVLLFIMIIFFALLFIFLSRVIRIEATVEQIIYSNLLGNRKEIRWDEIKRISFNNATKNMTIESATTKFKVHVYLKGCGSVLKLIKENVKPEIYGQVLNILGI